MQVILNQAPRLVTALLLIAMVLASGWQLYAFWTKLQAPPAGSERARETAAAPQVEPQPQVDLAAIDLFGTATGNAIPEQNTEDLPETNLRLVLRGVVADGTPADNPDGEPTYASALVEGPDQQTEYYPVGSSLPGDASLKAVYADRIVINRQGNLENLYFPEEFEEASFEMQDEAPTSSGMASSPAPSQPASSVSAARKEEIRARLDRLRERLRANN